MYIGFPENLCTCVCANNSKTKTLTKNAKDKKSLN